MEPAALVKVQQRHYVIVLLHVLILKNVLEQHLFQIDAKYGQVIHPLLYHQKTLTQLFQKANNYYSIWKI